MKKKLLILFVLILSTINYHLSTASAGMFEPLGLGARPLAMGKSFVALANDASCIYWNPAGLTQLDKDEIITMYSDLYNMGLISYQGACFAHPGIGGGAIGFGYTRLATSNKVDFLDFQENTFLFSYAISPLRYTSIGVNLKYYLADFETSGTGAGIDAGVLFNYDNIISIGVSAQDINEPTVQFQSGASDKVPLNLKAGMAVAPLRDLVIALDMDNINEDTKLHVGAEYWLGKYFAVRAGGINQYQGNWTYSGGIGIVYRAIKLDYAYQRHFDLEDTHFMSLGFVF
ncbi:MAG: conjugal transfer protein TraF [bacterium]|nr:conjugal transfer protein TraF [bacterium]